jgi:hypothetical protein
LAKKRKKMTAGEKIAKSVGRMVVDKEPLPPVPEKSVQELEKEIEAKNRRDNVCSFRFGYYDPC